MTESAKTTPIAIIGMGCLFPQATELRTFWSNIRRKVDAIKDIPATHWRSSDYYHPDPKHPDHTYVKRGAFLDPVDFPPLEFGIQPHSMEAIDTTQLLGLVVAREALKQAGYGTDREFDRTRVSVILGVTGTLELVIPLGARLGHPHWRKALAEAGVPDQQAEEVVQRIADSYVGWKEESFPGLLGNVVAGRIANRLNLQGTNCVVDAACASSLSALHLALLELQSGRTDMVVTGGMDTFNDIFMYMCFSKTPALSPNGHARPFDVQGDGTVLGEGLGCIIVKRLTDAERDGDKILAVIKGIGTSSDGKGHAIYAPSPEGQVRALRNAYEQAEINPNTIELIEAHGTGTKAGDTAELAALCDVFDSNLTAAQSCAIGSIKSQIGHTKAAAGAAGLIKAVLALNHKVLPPTIKVEQPLPPLESATCPFYVNTESRPWIPAGTYPRRAAVSSFGFGGSNFHVVLEEYQGQSKSFDWDGRTELFAWSADDPTALLAQINEALSLHARHSMHELGRKCRASFRCTAPYRLAMVVDVEPGSAKSFDAFKLKLAQVKKMIVSRPQSSFTLPDGIYYAHGLRSGGLGVLFPGQGSQYVGMLRDLACQAPQLLDALAMAEAAHACHNDGKRSPRLVDIIYPHSVWTKTQKDAAEAALRDTENAQPAIGALSWGAWQMLQWFGVKADAFAGHSFGELVALSAGGCFSPEAFMQLCYERGRCMAEAARNNAGQMLALRMSPYEAQRWLEQNALALTIANVNSPKQVVLAGPTEDINEALQRFSGQGHSCSILPVGSAFHSSLVATASLKFSRALQQMQWQKSMQTIYANHSAAPYPTDQEAAKTLLSQQIVTTVRFADMIQQMHKDGIRTFIEVGPQAKLTGLVQTILSEHAHAAMALDSSRGQREGLHDLARLLAQLCVEGHPVHLTRWQDTLLMPIASEVKRQGLTIPICGANYRNPRVIPSTAHETPSATKTVSATSSASTQALPLHRIDTSQVPGPTDRPQADPAKQAALPAAMPVQLEAQRFIDRGNAAKMTLPQQSLIALQQLAEQTARLHQQFLEGQNRFLDLFQNVLNGRPVNIPAPVLTSLTPLSPPEAAIVPKCEPPLAMASAFTSSQSTYRPLVTDPKVHIEPPAGGVQYTQRHAIAETNGLLHHEPSKQQREDLTAGIQAIISAKTGYPAEMLELDMELDADLGIDSIKRVEIFAAVQEKWPNAPAIRSEHLGQLRKLRDVVNYLQPQDPNNAVDLTSTLHDQAHNNGHAQNEMSPAADLNQVTTFVQQIIAEKTGYPPEMLESQMELDADLGIDSIKRVEIFAAIQERLPDAPKIQSEDLGKLRTLNDVVRHVAGSPSQPGKLVQAKAAEPDLSDIPVERSQALRAELVTSNGMQVPPASHVNAWQLVSQPFSMKVPLCKSWQPLAPIAIIHDASTLAMGLIESSRNWPWAVHACTWDTTNLLPEALSGIVCLISNVTSEEGWPESCVRQLQVCIQRMQAAVSTSHNPVAMVVTGIDGTHGVTHWPEHYDPKIQGLIGLLKAAKQEYPWMRFHHLDINPQLPINDQSQAILQVLQHDCPTEVGHSTHGWTQLQLKPQTWDVVNNGNAMMHKAIEPGDVVLVTGGARGITAAVSLALARAYKPTLLLLGRTQLKTEAASLQPLTDEAAIKRELLRLSQQSWTPRQLQEQYAELIAQREVRSTLNQLDSLGVRYQYEAVDLRQMKPTQNTVLYLQKRYGQIRHVIHAAGCLADKPILELKPTDLQRVYETKVTSLEHVLSVLEPSQLKSLLLFSSTTARFGRKGQAAYALANEVLNKMAVQWYTQHPHCRVLALNWGPWDGGMVTPELKPIFRKENIDLIATEAGAAFVVELFSRPCLAPVEWVVMQGSLPADSCLPSDESLPQTTPSQQPATSSQDTSPALRVVLERVVNLDQCPVLQDHVLDGRAVLPMALIIEWLIQSAMHEHPGWTVERLEHIRLFKGVVLKTHDSAQLQWRLTEPLSRNGHISLECDVVSSVHSKLVRHASACLQLSRSHHQLIPVAPALLTGPREDTEIYSHWLFHGPRLHGIESVEVSTTQGIRAWVRGAPAPREWVRTPWRQQWIVDPLILDAAFQLAIVWTQRHLGEPCLPVSIGLMQLYGRFAAKQRYQIQLIVKEQHPHRLMADVAILNEQDRIVAVLDDFEAVVDKQLHQAFQRNRLSTPQVSV